MKDKIIAIVAVFIAISAMDFLIHGLWLAPTYEATAELWRPMDEMKNGLMTLITLAISIVFVLAYDDLVSPKSMKKALCYGASVGLIVALGFGFGSYGYMPIPLSLAISWFASAAIEFTVVGAIVGKLVK